MPYLHVYLFMQHAPSMSSFLDKSENVFSSVNIDNATLKQKLPDFDTRSCITSKSLKDLKLKKRDKKKLRHELWIKSKWSILIVIQNFCELYTYIHENFMNNLNISVTKHHQYLNLSRPFCVFNYSFVYFIILEVGVTSQRILLLR